MNAQDRIEAVVTALTNAGRVDEAKQVKLLGAWLWADEITADDALDDLEARRLEDPEVVGAALDALDEAELDDDDDLDDEACPGCGCLPGDGVTEGCDHPGGCGTTRAWETEA